MSQSGQGRGARTVLGGTGGLSVVERTVHNEEREKVGSMTRNSTKYLGSHPSSVLTTHII